jgi:hypothetical protein
MPRRSSAAQYEFGFTPRDGSGDEPPPHTDADYVPSPDSDAPLELTAEERDILAKLIGGEDARAGRDHQPRRARSSVERAIDRAADRAWRAAMVAAGTSGNWDEATRIANLGPDAFRGASPTEPLLPGTV